MTHDLLPLPFSSPILNAAGSLGFAPAKEIDTASMGAFFTNPISLAPRTPARGTRFVSYSGGFLLHTGLPNPGLRITLQQYTSHWRRARLPVFVHILSESPDDVRRMVRVLEEQDAVAGIELGLPPDSDLAMMNALLAAAVGERPVIVRLPLSAMPLGAGGGVAEAIAQAQGSGISIGAPRGAYPLGDGDILEGRWYGNSLFPLVLKMLVDLLPVGLPIFPGVGVATQRAFDTLIEAGATGVQLGAGWFWKKRGVLDV